MAKFVTFDDSYGTYNWRAIFPSETPNAEIKKSVERKLLKNLRSRGYSKEDMPSNQEIKDWLFIRKMKDGQFYEPEHLQWND